MATKDDVVRKRNCGMAGFGNTSETVSATRERAMADVTDTPHYLPATREPRCRVSDLHLAFVAEKEIAKEHAKWRDSEVKAHWDTNHAPPAEGPGAAISAWAAEGRSRVSGQAPSEAGEKLQGGPVSAAKEREPASWKRFEAFKPEKAAHCPRLS